MTKNITKIDSLTRFENDEIELFIDPQGNSFASLRGVARMVDKTAETVRRFSLSRNLALQEVEIDTGYGKKLVTLFDEDQIVEVLEKYNTKRLKQFAKLGVRTALHQIAGYKQQPVAKQLKPIDIRNLDRKTIDLLISYQAWQEFDTREEAEAWYKDPYTPTLMKHSPAKSEALDDRLKAMPASLLQYVLTVFDLKNSKSLPNNENYQAKLKLVSDPNLVAAADEFQLQIDRSSQPQISGK